MAIVYSSVPNRRAGWNKCAGEKILDKLQMCRGENVLKEPLNIYRSNRGMKWYFSD